jgi:uncharacterized membrane protein YccC
MTLSAVIDHLFPPDPGLLRLLAALRATLAGVMTFFVVVLLGLILDLPVIDRVLGFAISLFIAATVRDSDTRQKFVTILLGGLAAGLATMMAAALIRHPVAGAAVLPPIMFVVAYFSIRSPRYASMGLVAMVAYLIGLVSKQPLETVPARWVILFFATADAALIRCLLLPERPQAELERLRRGVRRGIAKALRLIEAAVSAGEWTPRGRAGLRREVARLGEIIMLAQARLATLAAQNPGQGSRWLQLLEIELAVERVARIALGTLGSPAERPALLTRFADLRQTPPPPAGEPGGGKLGAALDMLGRVLRRVPRTDLVNPAAAPAPAGGSGWRPAFQTGIAGAIAIACSELVLPNRWYWAAFAAFVMFQGTRSRGESIAKGTAFVIGTFAGMVAGVVLAALLAGHELLSVTAIVAAVFLAFQANVVAYGVMIFWITIILGLLFGMLGYITFDLLLLRLEEAAIGAASGVVVACFVLVRRERAVTHDAAIGFLRALRELVRSAATVLLGRGTASGLPARIMAVEQAFRDLSAIAAAQQSSVPMSHDEALQRRITLLGACDNWARDLGTICLTSGPLSDPALADLARRAGANIDGTLRDLTSAPSTPPTARSDLEGTRNDVVPAAPDDAMHRAVRLLLRIDAALRRGVLSGGAAGGEIAERGR